MKKYLAAVIAIALIFIALTCVISAKSLREMKIEQKVIDAAGENNEVRVIIVMKDMKKYGVSGVEGLKRAAKNEVKVEIGESKIKHEFNSFNGFSASINREDIRKLEQDERIERIIYDKPVRIALSDSVPLVNASLAWQLRINGANLTGKGEAVCILDTGIDYTHPDLGNCTPSKYQLNGTNESYVIESEHNYSDNLDYTWNITKAGYSKIAVHFKNISLEYPGQAGGADSLDRIIIYSSTGREIARYRGAGSVIEDLWTPYSDGNTIYVRLVTDEFVNDYGFYIDQVRNGTTNTTYNWSGCSKVVGGWDFVNNDGDPKDDHGHGTHVAGIAAANGSVKGVAPEAKLIAIKVMDSGGSGWTSDVIAGIEWCTNRSVDFNISVISMSLGGGLYSSYCDSDDPLTATAVNNATLKNISVIIATGNGLNNDGVGRNSQIAAPACVSNAVRVGATTKAGAIASYSNRNSITKLFAPGSSITSTKNSGGYESRDGTSMATPHVSGAYAIINQFLRAKGQSKTPQEIETILFNAGRQFSEGANTFSSIDVYGAVLALDSGAPNVSLIVPANNYLNITAMNLNITFRCNATDDFQLSNGTLFLWNSSGIYNSSMRNFINASGTLEFNLTNIPEGRYSWNCLFYDLSGNSAYALSNFSLAYDKTKPAIAINLPVNNSFNNGRFNISLNENGSCKYSLNDAYNITLNSSDDMNFYAINSSLAQDDLYNITYYCNDSAGNINSTIAFYFRADMTAPNISISSPSSGYSATGTTNVNFQYNISDNINISQCTLVLNNAIAAYNSSAISSNETNTISYSVPVGSYSWQINCTDEAGNTGNSSAWMITINSQSSDNNNAASSSGGGGGGGGAIYTASNAEFTAGYSKALKKDDSIRFELKNALSNKSEFHSVKVNAVGSDYANITIASNPIKITLSVGQSFKINLTSAEYYEIYVGLDGISGNYANVSVKAIHEPLSLWASKWGQANSTIHGAAVSEEKKGSENNFAEKTKTTAGKIWNAVVIIFIISFAAAIIYFVEERVRKDIGEISSMERGRCEIKLKKIKKK